MNEYPLLCKPEVVRAIRDGRQTQDRRPVKPQPTWAESKENSLVSAGWNWRDRKGNVLRGWPDTDAFAEALVDFSPYKPGDVLWVREPFAIKSKSKPLALQRRPIECYMEYVHGADQLKEGYELVYRADSDYPVKWRPSIHMLREFCRLRLRVKRVWVERVQDKNDWVWCCEFEKEEKQTCGNCQKKCKADPNAYNACPDWKPKTISAGS